MPTRSSLTVWSGDLAAGSGTVSLESSGAATFPVNFPARSGEPDGITSPEELIAAAHSACYAMSLSHGLATAGTPAATLSVAADVTLDRVDGALLITEIVLMVSGIVPGITEDVFVAAAEAAKVGCPVSKALAGVPDIRLEVALV